MAQKPEFNEVATIANGRDVTRGYVDALHLLPSTDPILRTRGGYKAFQETLRDDQVATVFQQRRLAIVGKEWVVDPGGDAAADQAAADSLRENLKRVDWDRITDLMMYGVFYGFSVAECLWARDGARIVLGAVKVRDRRRFGFAPDGGLRLMTSANLLGEPVPERKFWVFATGADNDDEPYGRGLAHWLYWPVFIKRNTLRFWSIYLEKFGAPTALGKYQAGTTKEEVNKLMQALAAIQTDAGIAIPEGMAIELLEATRTSTGTHADLVDRMDAAIAKIVLGQTLTVDAAGGQYKADVQNDVRLELVKADADLICGSFNRQVAAWLTGWNFPGAAVPTVYRTVADEEDLGARADRDLKIFQMGFAPAQEYVDSTYGEGFEPRPPAPAMPGMPPAAFADPATPAAPGPDAAAALSAQAAAQADPVITGMLDEARALLADVGTLEEFRDRLLDAYPGMDAKALAGLLAKAMLGANLAGRAEVKGGE